MKAFVSAPVLSRQVLHAGIVVAVIMAGHWYRYRQFDLDDFLCAAAVFLVYLVLGLWMAARAARNNSPAPVGAVATDK